MFRYIAELLNYSKTCTIAGFYAELSTCPTATQTYPANHQSHFDVHEASILRILDKQATT